MNNRPQTLYAIADSPVGLAAWILDHDIRSYRMIARAFDGRRVDTRSRFADSLDLFGLVDALWPHCRSESLASSRAGVADGFAAADAEFLRNADRDFRGLRIRAAGSQGSCGEV